MTSSNGLIHTAFGMGKTRFAPLKVIKIPRLEFADTILAVRIDRMLKRELELNLTDSVLWTDSTSVLKYILNDTRRFQTYVANRVSTISEHPSHKSQWCYIKTELNPADSPSKGTRTETFFRKRVL